MFGSFTLRCPASRESPARASLHGRSRRCVRPPAERSPLTLRLTLRAPRLAARREKSLPAIFSNPDLFMGPRVRIKLSDMKKATRIWMALITLGGEGGIRTLGPRKGSTVFETAPFDHSGTSPMKLIVLALGTCLGFEPRQTPGQRFCSAHPWASPLVTLGALRYRASPNALLGSSMSLALRFAPGYAPICSCKLVPTHLSRPPRSTTPAPLR